MDCCCSSFLWTSARPGCMAAIVRLHLAASDGPRYSYLNPLTSSNKHQRSLYFQKSFCPFPAFSTPSPRFFEAPSTPLPRDSIASPTGFPALPVTPVMVWPTPRPPAPTTPPTVFVTPLTPLPRAEVTKVTGLSFFWLSRGIVRLLSGFQCWKEGVACVTIVVTEVRLV